MKKLLIVSYLSLVAVFAFLAGCASDGGDALSEQIAAVDEALAEADYEQAQEILDDVLRHGTRGISEENLGRLSVQLMRLSEHSDNEENVAAAATCFREAYRLSADSLRSFSSTLTPEEQAHFYLVKRIVAGIDNPVDLTSEEFLYEDSVAVPPHVYAISEEDFFMRPKGPKRR